MQRITILNEQYAEKTQTTVLFILPPQESDFKKEPTTRINAQNGGKKCSCSIFYIDKQKLLIYSSIQVQYLHS